MGKSVTVLTAPFTISQAADTLKTLFDARGWGTGLVSIQGGYRITASMASDSVTTPISMTSANVVTKPTSWNGAPISVDWVDNFNGKDLIYPSPHSHCLCMWLPGVKRVRLKFTIVKRIDNATTGNFSDFVFRYGEQKYSGGGDVNEGSVEAVLVSDHLTGSYTVGSQYTTKWSHGDTATFAGSVQSCPMFLIASGSQATIKIDAIEYEATQDRFAFQSPNQDGATFEVSCENYINAFARLQPIPQKDSWKARVYLGLPDLNYYSTNNLWNFSALSRYWNKLWNYSREDNLQNTGVFDSVQRNNYAIFKNFGFGSNLNVLLSSNSDYSGFYVESRQSGKATCSVTSDNVLKSTSFPATSVIIPERRITVVPSIRLSDYTNAGTPENSMFMFQIKNSAKVLKRIYISNAIGGSSNIIKIYKLNVSTVSGKRTVIFNGLHASATATLAGYEIKAEGLSISLPVGYYGIAISPDFQARSSYDSKSSLRAVTTDFAFIGNITVPSCYNNASWITGTTQLNITSHLDTRITGTQTYSNDLLDLFMDLDSNPTPSQLTSSFAEGTAMLDGNDIEGGNVLSRFGDIDSVGQPRTMGVSLPFGLNAALNTIEPNALWYLSPFPGQYPSLANLAYQSVGFGKPVIEFDSYSGIFDAWADRGFRTPIQLKNIKLRTTNTVGEGSAYLNPDTTEDIVIKNIIGSNSVCFRSI